VAILVSQHCQTATPRVNVPIRGRNKMNTEPDTEKGFLSQGLDPAALKLALRRCLERVFDDPNEIPLFFTDDYVQTTDGITCDRKEFEQHVRHLASVVRSIQFEVLDALQQGERLADRHSVHVAYRDGRKASIEVYLFGTTHNGRLRRVHEITRISPETQRSAIDLNRYSRVHPLLLHCRRLLEHPSLFGTLLGAHISKPLSTR